MGIAELEPRQLAPTVGTMGSGFMSSPAPSSPSTTSRSRLADHLLQHVWLHHRQFNCNQSDPLMSIGSRAAAQSKAEKAICVPHEGDQESPDRCIN
jgi:hypothetical protein